MSLSLIIPNPGLIPPFWSTRTPKSRDAFAGTSLPLDNKRGLSERIWYHLRSPSSRFIVLLSFRLIPRGFDQVERIDWIAHAARLLKNFSIYWIWLTWIRVYIILGKAHSQSWTKGYCWRIGGQTPHSFSWNCPKLESSH